MLEILQNNWLLFLVGQYPHGPIGGLTMTLFMAVTALTFCFPFAIADLLQQYLRVALGGNSNTQVRQRRETGVGRAEGICLFRELIGHQQQVLAIEAGGQRLRIRL